MSRQTELNFRLYMLGVDVILTLICLFLAQRARLEWPFGADIVSARTVELSPVLYLLVAILWIALFNLLSVYSPRKMNNLVQELQTTTVGILVATACLAGVLYLSFRDVPRLLFVYFFAFDLIALLGFRTLTRMIFQVRTGSEGKVSRAIILGAGRVGQNVARAYQRDQGWYSATIIGFLDDDPEKHGQVIDGTTVLGDLEQVVGLVQEQAVDLVIFALPLRAHSRLFNLVLELQKLPVDVKVVPDLFDLAFARTSVEEIDGVPLICLRESAINGYPRWAKRIFDFVMAGFLLLITAPMMGLISLAIKLDSRGSIIFSQTRVGENGRLFKMYKFRTMIDGAESKQAELIRSSPDGNLVHKRPDDPRVTRLGRFLRRSSLDELPQLVNVLKGEMSLVGPRPELPFIVDQYEPWQRQRLAVPPGITGWWQISGRADRPMHLHTEDDMYYIHNHSMLLDLQILLKTVEAVIKGRGAY